ncbi:MAG TPA: sigma factor, partial [Rudaea sp.]|nr:sigma factor [Rudaea sp.]
MSFDPALRARLHQLLADYGARVRSLIEGHGIGQYGIDAADIEQEVRIRLWRALERDRNAAFHASYIHRTVLSAVIDAIRAAN